LPKPYSWFVPKDDAADPTIEISDFAYVQPGDEPVKSPASGDFVWQVGDAVQLTSPEMIGLVHNTSADPNCKSEEMSQVYRYEALAVGQTFAGVVLSANESALEMIKALLEAGDLRLGGSHTAGYGRVAITQVTTEQAWREFTPLPAVGFEGEADDEDRTDEDEEVTADSAPEYAIITCLSDLIWRDAQGQVSDHLLSPSGKEPIRAYYRLRPVGGFNRKWGLPICQSWAIQAGSVFVFPPDCYAELQTWAEHGIGERRAEGYGRVALNWHNKAQIAQSIAPIILPAASSISLSSESNKLAQEMANRQLQVLVEQRLINRIQELSQFQALPQTAHLSRARLAARRAWHKADLQEIVRHFNQLSPTAVKQWEKARLNQTNFKNWILQEITQVQQFTLVSDLPEVAGVKADFSDMRDVTLARLIEGVLRQAVKKAKARAEGGQDDQME
jgi:CRISPR-associated protein Csx10